MSKLLLYHGSTVEVGNPVYGKGKAHNDYGLGFYCTEHIELAKEWACGTQKDGYVNHYSLDMTGLKILDLSDERYSILHWLSVLTENRLISIPLPIMKNGLEYLQNEFHVDLQSYDVIKGYRADDSYYQFVRAFLANTISVSQLSESMRLGNLGEQYMIKSPKAFEKIEYVGCELVDAKEYYLKRVKRNETALHHYYEVVEKGIAPDDLYLNELIAKGVKADDSRIR